MLSGDKVECARYGSGSGLGLRSLPEDEDGHRWARAPSPTAGIPFSARRVVGHLERATEHDGVTIGVAHRQGGGEWLLEVEGTVVGKGGILFHYNPPYGDLYMEVAEGFRRRGLGSYLVQELKRRCYELRALPAARCDPTNVASRRTLQTAGLIPHAQMLIGSFK